MQMMNKIKKVREWKSLKDIPFINIKINSRRIGMSVAASKLVVKWTVDPQQDLDYMNALSKEEDESR